MPGSAANPAFPTAKTAGRKTIAVTTVSEALGLVSDAYSEVIIKALSTNTGLVYVKPDGTAGQDYTGTGYPLSPGEVVVLPVKRDLSEIVIDTATNNNVVAYLAIQTEAR